MLRVHDMRPFFAIVATTFARIIAGRNTGADSALTAGSECTARAVQPLLDALFQSLGADCPKYVSLFAENATYFHAHDGFKTKSQLLQNCQNYGAFCPQGSCLFRQNGAAQFTAVAGKCHVLAPYLWSELPANAKVPGNLEPHTGWEYIIAVPSNASAFGFSIERFAEIETSYSVAYNWADPLDASAYNWTLRLLRTTASKGECDVPIASVVTSALSRLGAGWRQQGDAVVLAAGGLCHVAVPYAAQLDGGKLCTGNMVLALEPGTANYTVQATLVFEKHGGSATPSTPVPSTAAGSQLKVIEITLGVFGAIVVLLGVVVVLHNRRKHANATKGEAVAL